MLSRKTNYMKGHKKGKNYDLLSFNNIRKFGEHSSEWS